jgi:large conductance mechanosensitive channel
MKKTKSKRNDKSWAKNMWKEFKEFAVKGNAVDLAVGVIVGAAFTGIINSLVKDVIMPPISLLTGGLDFSNKFVILRAAKDGSMAFNTPADAAKAGAITWNYGNFITLAINFLIVAGAVFLLVRAINKLRKPEPTAEKEPDKKDCPACAMKIPFKATRCPYCTTELSEAAAR